jgi:hypothetical protein
VALKKREPVSPRKAKDTGKNSQGRLFVSFWNISLDNIPQGGFTKRLITPRAANRLIKQARTSKCLVCVSKDDLFAPYRLEERENHEELCCVLTEHFNIAMTLNDFTDEWDEDDPGHYINPLEFAHVEGGSRLLVVTCNYVLEKPAKRGGKLVFTISPASVEFHLLESASKL